MSLEISWQAGTERLVCRWSEVGKRVPYNPPWMQDAPKDIDTKNLSAPMDFTKLSPFGGRDWYVPNRLG